MSSSSPAPRSSRPGARLPPFYRDLASPISSHHRAGARSAAAAHAADAAAAAPWRGGFGGAAPPPPPPPPLFTLDDRVDFSPDPAFGELPPSSPRSRPPPRPDRRSFSRSPSLSSPPSSSSSALRIRAEASSSGGVGHGATPGAAQSSGRSSWMTPERGTGVNYLEKGKGSPVEGVVEPGALIAHPTNVKEVAPAPAPAPQDLGMESVPNGGLDDEEWIAVFGFYPSDTNHVLREFEKCGVILRHLPGPSNSNWIHILYEHRYDARKALEKNGTQLTSALTIGVKSVDLIERQLLNERLNKLNRGGFMVSLPSKPSVKTTASSSQLGAFLRPYHPKSNTNAIGDSGRRATGSIASPAQSLVSKVADLVFGL